jgi:hypothetical protein
MNHGTHRVGLTVAALGALLGLLIFAGAIAYTFNRQASVDARLCHFTVTNRSAIRATWKAAERLVVKGRDKESQERTRAFFAEVLRPIPALECRDNRPRPVGS